MQTNGGFIHRRFGDAVTSRYIPLGLACASTVLLVPGLFSMYLGISECGLGQGADVGAGQAPTNGRSAAGGGYGSTLQRRSWCAAVIVPGGDACGCMNGGLSRSRC